METLVSTICLCLILIASGAPTSAQSAKGLSENSYKRARQVLEAGLRALGGSDTFQSTEDISVKYRGKVFEQGQSANPEASYDVRQEEGIRIIDIRGKRSSLELKTNYRGGDPYWGRQVLNDKSGFTLDLTTNVAYPIASSAVASRTRSVQRLFPHLLLQEALSRAGTLRWLADGAEGRQEQVITFADVGGNQIGLYFDGRTHLLTKFESLGDDPIFGDVLWEICFSDYREVAGLKVPTSVIFKYAGKIISDLTYVDIEVNTRPAAEVFQVPSGFQQGPETLGPLSPSMTKLAEGVYFVNGMSGGAVWFYSQLLVAFKDYVLVVESPLNNGVSQAVIAKISELIPGKPIRYLVPTHYHFDHLGGIREYISEGATVVTTTGNKGLIERIAAAPHTIRPDALSQTGRKPLIETFTGKRTFSDGKRTVEFYDIGRGPHAEEMIIAYLPQEKIAFVSDLCMTRIKGKMPPASDTNLDFDQKIRQLNLQIQTIANGHGWIGTMEDFRKGLQKPVARKKLSFDDFVGEM
ncbi:MAG TPA: MBL fold metallo-hydrolase [Pyrinomonadaceae bacterium]|nr:MBL fold metallo-hydrolase [Pyrinomonadaceae bacterium]